MRQRLIELYNTNREKTIKAIDTWRRDNRYPKVTFRPEEWKGETLTIAKIKHENQVNLIYIKQTMTDRDVEWVIKDIMNTLTDTEKKGLWESFCACDKMKKNAPSDVNNFFPNYDHSLSNDMNVKAFKKWKKQLENDLKALENKGV